MVLSLPSGEPAAGPWRTQLVETLARQLASTAIEGTRPHVVAVDGRGGSGKSTLAAQLHAVTPRSAVVHTDDIAWHHSFFDWADILAGHVLEPLRTGRAVRYRPPGWETRQRPGAVEVPAGLDLVIVEGVGASQRSLAGLVDAIVWVQSDFVEAERRGIARDVAAGENGDVAEVYRFWHEWMAQELPFLAEQRPWERATVIVRGTSSQAQHPTHVATAPPPQPAD
jgi:hypothetical protein